VAVLGGAGVAVLGATTGHLAGARSAAVYGLALALVTALVALAASYVVVEATADGGDRVAGDAARPFSPWALAVVQAVLPLAASAPVALALQAAL
ncbi:MAG: hypothetical protein JWQ99_592, partial [Blastococcus sp.]|nr:hypothetical protein [Blastococcus sp.]